MKKIIIFTMLLMPAMLWAQSWETVPSKATEVNNATTPVKKLTKSEKEALKLEAERPYLKGAVPEIDGKVVYHVDINVPGKTAQEIYDLTFNTMNELTTRPEQHPSSKVALVNRDEKKLIAKYDEWMVFTSKLLELDRAKFSYVIEAECKEGVLTLDIQRLHYVYGEGKDCMNVSAEELIVDKVMLSKDGTKLNKYNSKFRRKTVDRIQEIVNVFKAGLL